MRFPYIVKRGKPSPIVPVRLKGVEWVTFGAYVDSGASYSIFKSEMAEILGLELEEGKKEYITVGDGSLITAYLHELDVEFAGERFKAVIGFSRRLGIGFNILGRKDFFEKFRVCFDEKDRIVEIEVD